MELKFGFLAGVLWAGVLWAGGFVAELFRRRLQVIGHGHQCLGSQDLRREVVPARRSNPLAHPSSFYWKWTVLGRPEWMSGFTVHSTNKFAACRLTI
jgi:hypothetical protein